MKNKYYGRSTIFIIFLSLTSCNVSSVSDYYSKELGLNNNKSGSANTPTETAPTFTVSYNNTNETSGLNTLSFSISDTSGATHKFQCRTALKSAINSAHFASCSAGSSIAVNPGIAPNGGTIVTQVQSFVNGVAADVKSSEIYVHPSLNSASTCTAAHTDDWYLAQAAQYLDQSYQFLADTSVKAPFMSLHFNDGQDAAGTLSLRKKMIMNNSKSLVLLKRIYKSVDRNDCVIRAQGVHKGHHTRDMHPINSCEVVVMNALGEGQCLDINSSQWVYLYNLRTQLTRSNAANGTYQHSSMFSRKEKKSDDLGYALIQLED